MKSTTLTHGDQLGRYRVKLHLGAGGMGEVYLAQDTSELERHVALKVLPADVASDQQRMQRFVQEAKTISTLNHPNILTIHEIGQAKGTRFIVTEYIDGVTLRKHMGGKRVKLHEVLDIAIQIAAALDAAHEAKVVHRDIKPENIMVRRRDHIVKVLDFGLAKLADNPETQQQQQQAVDTEAGTKVLVHTEPGRVMGTAQYMSPEQSQGLQPVDHRTDIWSLGVLLYEMVAGRVPFEGKDIHRQIIAIQESDPLPLSRCAEGVPDRLEEIVEKALAKSADERYQTAKDFLIDLRNLKRRLEVDAEIERTVPPELRSATSGSKDAAASSQSTASQESAPAATAEQPSSTSSAEYLAGGIKRHKLTLLIALPVIISAAIGLYFYLHARDTEIAIDSIAVLPFVNQNNDPEVEYRSDGLTESIINSLTRLPALRVVARSTVFRYKGREIDPMAVGKELGVRAVLTGRVMQRGDNLTVSVELLDVRDNLQLWGEQYERKVSDLLAVEREIAKDISANLRPKLTGAEQARVAKSGTENQEAYQLYLKGRFFLNSVVTEEGNKRALEHFKQAVALDPNYALAYAGLADGYSSIADWAIAPTEAMPKAKAAAKKALELDESLSEAHVSLANVLYRYEYNWAEAEKEFKRAIELSPRDSWPHESYVEYLYCAGRFDEALEQLRIAKELNPLLGGHRSYLLIALHQYDQAIEDARKSVDRRSNSAYSHMNLGIAYQQKGRLDEAVAEFERARQLDNTPFHSANLAESYALAGRRTEAQKILNEVKELSKQRYVSPFYIAQIYAGLNDKDQAFSWLDKAFEERSDSMAYIKVDWSLTPLRSDPRFADLLRRVGLSQ